MILHLHAHTLHIAARHVRTVLPGGAVVEAVPHDTDAYRETSRDLGYGTDTARMNREHDLAHIMLARMLGLPVSPVLAAVAGGTWCGGSCVLALEEGAVAAVLRFANALGVDLVRCARND